ncbi:hypothetical protein P153DRAFT_385896 [Dothidotthia symphoricarpi CBS 119687]|uniref:Xylanolytic transcriptional activator regulatory domain-containing protein n=1 Tax=Dothidotthia symphoricarpi CBS 119687 TaxID=1392245 RepID=A0A6A6AFG2_9PLEO|nr:uncharacterized protein P153DRAFT_385896 [Dothidotthia symphoricarpi CBS 119687]KAF2129684.1 hypothetical protein P153DRAFT_385896 [Dothidotthia symphoricarpi CBS 119687]
MFATARELRDISGAGERPSCSLCLRWGILCGYTVPASSRLESVSFAPFPVPFLPTSSTLLRDFQEQAAPESFQFLGVDLDTSTDFSTVTEQQLGYSLPISDLSSFPADLGVGLEGDAPSYIILPTDDVLIELIDLFFDHIYHILPCFHKRSFMTKIREGSLQAESPMLLSAMCAIVARRHHDASVRSWQNEWYEFARREYNDTTRLPSHSLRGLQAAVCIMIHAYTIGDFSTAWLVLGKAWRQICALGFNRLDADDWKPYGLPDSRPQTDVEKEELRRTLWLHFVMDRNHSWPTGWPHAIDERQFMVAIPVSENIFQAMSPVVSYGDNAKPTPFTRRLNILLLSQPTPSHSSNVFHYLVLSHVLLGRVTETIHSLHDSPGSSEYAEECDGLASSIAIFRLSLPRTMTSLFEAPAEERGQIIWLGMSVNTTSILLHYWSAGYLDEDAANEQFSRAVIAAKNTVQIVKDASSISTELLLSAHVAASLYIAACVLIIQWRMTNNDNLKDDIDTIGLVFDRFSEVFTFIGLKFKIGLEHDLQKDMENIVELRTKGLKGLLADCSKWTNVQETLDARGIQVNIT